MFKLAIKKESLATRCEICHKSDHFDREKGSCSRCEKLIVAKSDKGTFIINWQVDLSLLSNTLRNFTWQNVDSRLIKGIRLALGIGIICSFIFLFIDHQIASSIDEYYILPLPKSEFYFGEASQIEDFPEWGVCGSDPQVSLEGVIIGSVFLYILGSFITAFLCLTSCLCSKKFYTQPSFPKPILDLS